MVFYSLQFSNRTQKKHIVADSLLLKKQGILFFLQFLKRFGGWSFTKAIPDTFTSLCGNSSNWRAPGVTWLLMLALFPLGLFCLFLLHSYLSTPPPHVPPQPSSHISNSPHPLLFLPPAQCQELLEKQACAASLQGAKKLCNHDVASKCMYTSTGQL